MFENDVITRGVDNFSTKLILFYFSNGRQKIKQTVSGISLHTWLMNWAETKYHRTAMSACATNVSYQTLHLRCELCFSHWKQNALKSLLQLNVQQQWKECKMVSVQRWSFNLCFTPKQPARTVSPINTGYSADPVCELVLCWTDLDWWDQ